MTETAVIDRFENGWAVLLVGEDERQLDVDRTQLPLDAKEGDWLQVEIADDRLVRAVVDAEATAQASQRIMSKLERLRRGDHRKQG